MRCLYRLCLIALCLATLGVAAERPRVLVLTDIENEPDDAQSLIRFLLYSNQWDTEGLVATTSAWQRRKLADWRIHQILHAYDQVRDNLERHERGFPSAADLRSRVKRGYPDFGMAAVGEGKDSEGSDWIIHVLDQPDERPLWVTVWGGANTLAQALWKLQQTRPEAEVEQLVRKLRVYAISDQDNSGPWLRRTFPELFYIVSPGYHEHNERAYHHATWIGIAGERWYRFPSGADRTIVDNPWLGENIQRNRGPLGAEYPNVEYIMEGDSPSFLHLIDNGLNMPERPDYGGWGGRYQLYTPPAQKWFHEPETRPIWTNTEDLVEVDGVRYLSAPATIWRWRTAFQNDFAARMLWCVRSPQEANHPPVPQLRHPNMLTVRSGERVTLDASPTTDPDGDELSYHWWLYFEPGSYLLVTDYQRNRNFQLEMAGRHQARAEFVAPQVDAPKSLHLILEVTDKGTPALTRYQRVIVNLLP
jgi:hypothetical protein